MQGLVEATNLRKCFGGIVAVDDISLSVRQGEVLGFLGPNGAGKSTTMKMITGFLTPDRGNSKICGLDVEKDPIAAKSKLGYLPEGAPLYAEMTTSAFLSFIAEMRGFDGKKRKERIGWAAERTGLGPVFNQRIETLSKGFKRRVGLAQAILHDPPVLIMDEPTDGLDPNQKHHVRELIKEMAPEKAIIISTHILEEVEAVCSRAVIISHGRIVADGTAEDLMRRVPYHGAVLIRVAKSKKKSVLDALAAHPSLARIETVAEVHGQIDLRAIPANGAPIAGEVASTLRSKKIAVDELFVERGKLDDVFREITMPEDSARNA